MPTAVNGQVGELLIYNNVLTTNQITSNYNVTKSNYYT
jgi:hypothetical protein